ncbi:AraC family ligand binding domain-containing protein [Bordetella genomosp. 13]|uniref:AraC family ligand binding domain-containing protein n=1 Tax=Bordetella genomosp. 13 TaxID=463040 RepID=UPI00119E4921|nr:AraC family ligand binding domain-containing protein [Bordetella genomosp. 13]
MHASSPERQALPFLDQSGLAPRSPEIWEPLLVPRESIEAEVERLCRLAPPANGVRAAAIVHPSSRTANGFTPGTSVTIGVLLPGERTVARKSNANLLEIGIRGHGRVTVDGSFDTALNDVWTIPSMRGHIHENTGSEPWVRLSYSNAPLLELLGVLYEEEGVAVLDDRRPEDGLSERQKRQYAWENSPDLELTDAGARLRGYEYLTDIPVVPNPALHWPWKKVWPHLAQEPDDGRRRIWLLYHPATERRNGTTGSYFATIGGCPAGTPVYTGRHGHRHTSASINYHISGHGYSMVDGVRVDWKAGDLLLSAPGWSEHAHYHGEDGWRVLTVQDHPLHIAMGSLLWQEKYDGPILALGSEAGQKGYTAPRSEGK